MTATPTMNTVRKGTDAIVKNLDVTGTLTVDTFALGDPLEVDTINEATPAAGVTVEAVLIKDGGVVLADAAVLEVDTINEATSTAGVTVDSLLIKDGKVDLNGVAGALILDADADTLMGASTDDQIDFTISAAIDFQMTANTFTAVSGSTIATNTIAETTGGSGVTIDGALIKDGAIRSGTQITPVDIAGDGAITVASGTVTLSKGGAAAITIVAPTTPAQDDLTITVVATTAQAHVITCATVGFNAKGSSGTLTFGGAIGDTAVIKGISGNWYLVGGRNVTPA